ncbi:hypothetical protein CC85DRAFT_53969 [Cutaneotrichosporon oleaginosum]|uniref:Uncharacterized protein n=1 Tax=Cutaneotrichosporon oleaginosum TaxID=879819 RepID=A0A0J1BDF3_9TREE|nr:uncharacterized protein CC85DRAFT_53969 [Cutaneotrichosporon oleaginosum]KLT46089.1 hypothetical protein CC85DRAFT_53969 [Cutaneotrichosporon oleaginosum]TXT10102.1 hypothetical protein COLE_04036 [Cutaneotrichosporon oleaginosum]
MINVGRTPLIAATVPVGSIFALTPCAHNVSRLCVPLPAARWLGERVSTSARSLLAAVIAAIGYVISLPWGIDGSIVPSVRASPLPCQ